MRVYIASSLHNAAVVCRVAQILKEHGVDISYDWTTHGLIDDIDSLPDIGEREKQGVLTAKAVLMILPGRFGTHVELGIALGAGIPVVIWNSTELEEHKPFYYVAGVEMYQDEQESINRILEIVKDPGDERAQ